MNLQSVSQLLASRHTKHVLVEAADSFKITCKTKLPKGIDSGILDVVEGKSLRNRVSGFTTTLQLVNLYKKRIRNTITPDPYLHNGIDSIQHPAMKTYVRFEQYGGNYGREAPKYLESFIVQLVNAHGKPVYTVDDITPAMELKLTPIEK